MKKELQFDFTVDKSTKTVVIVREFDAELSLVWDAFTQAELLDKWVAPRPWSSKTKFMNFVEGGRRFYAMVSPEGMERWALQTYTSISPKTNFKLQNSFADPEGNPELPGSDWNYDFIDEQSLTKVCITIYNESLERMEKMIEMGFEQGFKMSIDNLDEVLSMLSKN